MNFNFYYISAIILVVLFIAEFVIDQKEKKHLYKQKETLHNLLIGAGLFLISFISRAMVLSAYYLAYSARLFTAENTWFTWVLAFVLSDFTYYWHHRASHKINWFWAAHSVHHSSEHYNVSVSFRQSWMNQFSGHFVFYLWLPFAGLDPLTVYTVGTISLFYQSWLHTELIGKLHPFFEAVFNSPSHHRVHHACNIKYLDKNHGQVLIVWDRLFGTFQKEEEKPTYGLTKKIQSGDLIAIMLGDWKSLFSKVFSAASFKDSINYLIQPPGWSHNGSSKTVKELQKEMLQQGLKSGNM